MCGNAVNVRSGGGCDDGDGDDDGGDGDGDGGGGGDGGAGAGTLAVVTALSTRALVLAHQPAIVR